MLNFFRKNSIIQKPIAGFLIFMFCLSIIGGTLYPTKKAEAWVGILDTNIEGWPNLFANIWPNIKQGVIVAKNIAVAIARKKMLDMMTDSIVAWINGEGKPQWLNGEMDDFLADVADKAGAEVLSEVVGKDVMQGLCQPSWGLKINIALQKQARFDKRLACTLSDVGANFNDFMDDFNNGGWGAWLRVSEGQNNPYGLYLTVLNEKLTREAAAQDGKGKELSSGGGFLSDKVCRQISYYVINDTSVDTANGTSENTSTSENASGTKQTESGDFKQSEMDDMEKDPNIYGVACAKGAWETRTPGQIAAEGLKKTVFKDIDWLKNNEEWESYAVAIGDALVNRLIKEGISGARDFASGSQSSTGAPAMPDVTSDLDLTPPEIKASPYDPWRIQLVSTEPVQITYTTDGRTPSLNAIGVEGLYREPIKVLGAVTLKWFGYDDNFNQSPTQTWNTLEEPPIGPPFDIIGLSAPVSVEGAVDSTSIVLLSNEPSTIYYTTDGSTPNTSSKKYIKKIPISGNGTVIRWFAVDLEGNRESTLRYLSTQPPFPNTTLTNIWNLAPPIPVISTDLSTTSPFIINPSLSADNDVTPKIVMYEWDFDNDGNYDWWTVDWNRDGIFDESKCRTGVFCSSGTFLGNGFNGMIEANNTDPGEIMVNYDIGSRQINLRVTDDEGLSTATSVIVNVEL